MSFVAKNRRRVQIEFPDDGRTKQSFKDECDINTILRGYQKNGIISHVRQVQGRYGDFIGAVDYQEALNQVILADEMFNSLPAKVRARFENDPAAFLDFAQNPSNEAEMRSMGLLRDTYVERAKAVSEPPAGASGAPSNSAAEEEPAAGSSEPA